ncbi:FG-GAP repeat domain-containing protein [Enhygromyxa salina]|uniref:FG-GAP repeat protein n=1 Tax=Enhygromyxa salina TaxID=215803 RepID=A0A2S9YW63_9BACT|nr:VCBS repeat-containing protein [Enhygromyxa salina]PRQ09351.1 hypothetical protein ENSA7_09400 [Enhygromyxa salina]
MTRLVDLDGEGVPGLVTETAGTWYFKRGLGDGRFGPTVAMPSRPTTLGAPGVQLMDLDGDGRKELVSFVAPAPGYFTRTDSKAVFNLPQSSQEISTLISSASTS